MDQPPDPGGRHVHACTECGLPLHEDQAACLSCGAMVEHGGGYAGIRRAAVGSATALLVLGSAVGAAVAGLPHGKDVPKKSAQAQVFGPNKAIPPATADAAPGAGDGATELPGADGGAKPPAIAPKAPHGSDSTSLPDAPSTGGGGGGVGTSGGGGGGGSSKSNGDDASSAKPSHEDKPAKPAKPALSLDPLGERPASATVFGLSGASSASGADYTIDDSAKTAWTTKKGDRGIMVTPSEGTFAKIGVISATPGWSLQIYYTNKADPGGISSGDWRQRVATNAEKTNRFGVPDARHYLVWVAETANKRVRVNEIQVYQ